MSEQPKPINREAVKVLAKAIGVREAARRMGLSEERVMKWSQRDPAGPWTLQADARTLATPSVTGAALQVSACPQPVRTASEALANTLADDSKASRIALSRGLRKGAEHVAQLPGEEVLAKSGNVRDLTTSLEKLHGWSGAQANVRVSVFAGPQPVEIEAEVTRLDQDVEQDHVDVEQA